MYTWAHDGSPTLLKTLPKFGCREEGIQTPSVRPFQDWLHTRCLPSTVCLLEPFLAICFSLIARSDCIPTCLWPTVCGLEPFLASCSLARLHSYTYMANCLWVGALLGHLHLPLAWPDCSHTCLWPTGCGLEPFLVSRSLARLHSYMSVANCLWVGTLLGLPQPGQIAFIHVCGQLYGLEPFLT